MPDGLIIVIFTIGGGFIGAFIKYVFDKRASVESERRVRKLQLYSSFVETFWEVMEDRQGGNTGRAAYDLSRLANEIALYGSDGVVRALAPVIGRDFREETMTSLILAMRADILDQHALQLFEPVRTILFERDDKLPPPQSRAGVVEELPSSPIA